MPDGGEHMNRLKGNREVAFAAPIIVENLITTGIGLVFSAIIGGISGSALAAMGLVNTFVNVVNSSMGFLMTGSTVLTARLVGEDDRARTSRAVEQAILLAMLVGCAVTIVCEALGVTILRPLLHAKDDATFAEGLQYYRMIVLSFPFLILYNAMVGMLRASGESRASLGGAIVVNVTQMTAAWLFISVLKMEMLGAGLAYVVCRLAGAAVLFFMCLRNHRHFTLHVKNIFRPDKAVMGHICRLGAPNVLESVSVQFAYLLANSLAMGLGTHEASVYQISNTLNSFSSLPQTIVSTVSVTLIGNLLGAKRYDEAKKCQRRLLAVSLTAAVTLGLCMAIFSYPLSGLYTKDENVQRECVKVMWLMIGYAFFGLLINLNDPILRVAGDMRYVMGYTVLLVWGLRLPFTWLFCYVLDMGAFGVQLANIVSLVARAAAGVLRIRKGKWVYLKV